MIIMMIIISFDHAFAANHPSFPVDHPTLYALRFPTSGVVTMKSYSPSHRD
jgi:hypothetical protein